ncbi:site-specific integrase [Methylobacter sp. BlB1]|uniref:tyrosine-type recombinase/integrase n=1 Tax=Methylobacter sp. BlB1 TaxID=2785914 RepID=UPI0018938EBC|nr:site-specific integrase [Methylobacter sp. BlB1]MBF6647186.1 tyrosine-type recombinase/integrase [Methylobacter sp. BlB1]
MAITTIELDALKPKNKPYIVREKQLHKKDGTLAFKMLPSAVIDAYFIYYIDGKEKLKKIGRYGKGAMSLKEIRNCYRDLSKEYQAGIDIKEQQRQQALAEERERQRQETEERKRKLQGSLQQLIDIFLDHLQANKSEHYYRNVKQAFDLNLRNLDTTRKANEITKTDIIETLHPITERGSLFMANRVRAFLSSMFKFGIEFDDTPETITHGVQFFIESNPVYSVRKPLKKEPPADRFLSEDEVRNFWQALESSSMSIHRANIFRLMLALGTRLEAISGLQWNEIDWQERLITIPPARSKNGNFWVIPLNDIAFEVISNNPKLHMTYLFPAQSGNEPLRTDGFSQAITRLCKSSGISKFTPRDLRTTFKTLTGKAGISKDIRDRIQNHALNDVSSKHYDRYDYLKEKRQALEIWNRRLTQIIRNEPDNAEVIPIRKQG